MYLFILLLLHDWLISVFIKVGRECVTPVTVMCK